MTRPKHAWMVRAGDNNELAAQVEKKGAIAVGWEVGDVSHLIEREQFKQRYREVFPDHSERRVAVNAGQIYRFVCHIRDGDYILTYDKSSRELVIGQADEGIPAAIIRGYSYEASESSSALELVRPREKDLFI